MGKSWLACALGHKACRENMSVLYARVPRLFADLAIAHGDARYARLLRSLARAKLLILDDWGPEALTADQARDLLETNRLLRVSTAKGGDREVGQVLDELERLLVEVANGPSELSEQQLQQIQERIQSQGLLFKVRVVGSKVRRSGNMGGSPGNVKQGKL